MVPIGFGGVTHFSKVMASIAEPFSNPGDAGQNNLPGIGSAHMYVRSVAPQNNVVFVDGCIDWERDLTVRICLLVARAWEHRGGARCRLKRSLSRRPRW